MFSLLFPVNRFPHCPLFFIASPLPLTSSIFLILLPSVYPTSLVRFLGLGSTWGQKIRKGKMGRDPDTYGLWDVKEKNGFCEDTRYMISIVFVLFFLLSFLSRFPMPSQHNRPTPCLHRSFASSTPPFFFSLSLGQFSTLSPICSLNISYILGKGIRGSTAGLGEYDPDL